MKDTKANVLAAVIIVLIIAAFAGADMLYAHVAYGDWTCAWKHCIETVPR